MEGIGEKDGNGVREKDGNRDLREVGDEGLQSPLVNILLVYCQNYQRIFLF